MGVFTRTYADPKIPFAQNARFFAYLRGRKDSFCTEWAFLRVLTRTQRFLLHRMRVFTRSNAHVVTCQRCLSVSRRTILHAKDSFCTLLRALAVSKVVSKTDFGDETTRIYVLNMPFRKQASECIRIYMPKIPFDRMRVYARCYGPAQISHSCAGSPKRYPHRARLTPSFRTVPHAMGFRAVLEPPDSEMAIS